MYGTLRLFPVYISPVVWNMCEHLYYESVYFKELHKDVVSTITSIFINDLKYAVPDVSLRLYADDTTLYTSDVSPNALQFVVNQGLSRLSEWFDANYLNIGI